MLEPQLACFEERPLGGRRYPKGEPSDVRSFHSRVDWTRDSGVEVGGQSLHLDFREVLEIFPLKVFCIFAYLCLIKYVALF